MKFYETQFVFSHYLDTLETFKNAIENEDIFVRKNILEVYEFINLLDSLERDTIVLILGVNIDFW